MSFYSPLPIAVRQMLAQPFFCIAAGLIIVFESFAGSPVYGQTKLSLHEAIELAQSSPTARIAQSRVDAIQGQVKQAGLRPNPRLFLQSEDLRPGANNFDFSNDTEDYGYLSQTFETGGKRAKRLQLAGANLRQTEAERALQLQQLDGRVAAAYWMAVSTARISQLLQQDLAAVDDMVQYQKERVDAGAMRGVDLLRMQIERDRLQIAFKAAQREATLARVDLARQIGRPISNDIELTDSIDAVNLVEQQPLAEVLTQRSDVAMAQEAVAAAQADLKLQKSLGVPDFDVLGGYKRNTGANTLYAGIQIPLPFRNRNQGEVERAQANLQMTEFQLEQVKLTAQSDVSAATATYTQELEIVQTTLPDIRERAKSNLAIMRDAYRTGGIDLLRYIDAERTEIDAEVSALRTLAEFHQSVVQLQLAYGERP